MIANHPQILHVEDHEDTRELVRLILLPEGLNVEFAETMDGGLKLARKRKFDLYLLDSWLPDGSGLDLCRAIRKFDVVTPILFLSAAAFELDRSEAIEAGAQGYLTKPTVPQELSSVVRSLLFNGRARKQGTLLRRLTRRRLRVPRLFG